MFYWIIHLLVNKYCDYYVSFLPPETFSQSLHDVLSLKVLILQDQMIH